MSRPSIQTHLHPGLRVIDTTSLEVYRLRNVWATDRQAQLVGREGDRHTVTYTDLFHHYQPVQPFGSAA